MGPGCFALFILLIPGRGFTRAGNDQFLTTSHWIRRSGVKSDGVITALQLCMLAGLGKTGWLADWRSPVYVCFLSCLHKSPSSHRGRDINVRLLFSLAEVFYFYFPLKLRTKLVGLSYSSDKVVLLKYLSQSVGEFDSSLAHRNVEIVKIILMCPNADFCL